MISHPALAVYATPVVGAIGLYFAITGPGWWEDFFFSHALSFLFSFWIGSGFSFVWWMLRQQADEMPGGMAMAGLVGVVGIALVAGLSVFSDPWLFGVAVWPGLTMLIPAVQSWLARRDQSQRDSMKRWATPQLPLRPSPSCGPLAPPAAVGTSS